MPMKTEIVRIDPVNPEREKIDYCGAVIRYGGLVAFPTETVYGLGANAFDAGGVRKIFEAKGRPADNPLIVHVSDYAMAELACRPDDGEQHRLFYSLGAEFWPGPLTMIVKKSALIPDNVTCGLPTCGIRMPSNVIARRLIEAAGVPVAAPSANASGKPSPTRFSHVFDDMNGKIDVIIDGGPCAVGVESTVLNLDCPVPTVLRPGAVTRGDIARVAGDCLEFDWKVPGDRVERPQSPGMKYRHYAPKGTLTVFSGTADEIRERITAELKSAKAAGKRTAVLATDAEICYYNDADAVFTLGAENDGRAHAGALFDALRRCDGTGAELIFAGEFPAEDIDDAVMNRMFRAAGGRIVPARDRGDGPA